MTIFITARWSRLTGPARGVLHGLSRCPPGIHFGGEVWLSFPGTTLFLAGSAARHAGVRRAAGSVRRIYRKPRPGCEHHRRPARALRNISRSISRHDRTAAARSLDAAAFSRPGIWHLDPIPLFQRHWRQQSSGSNSQRPIRISLAVSFTREQGNAATTADTYGSE